MCRATDRQNKWQLTHFGHIPAVPLEAVLAEGQFCKHTQLPLGSVHSMELEKQLLTFQCLPTGYLVWQLGKSSLNIKSGNWIDE